MVRCCDWPQHLCLTFPCRGRRIPWHASPALQGVLWACYHVPAPVIMGCFELHWGSTFYLRLSAAHMSKKNSIFSSIYQCILFCFLKPFKSPKPVSMENLPVNNGNGQSYGYTLYEATITSGGLLKSGDNVRDRALVSPRGTRWPNLSTSPHTAALSQLLASHL